jgi:hypothetical protein
MRRPIDFKCFSLRESDDKVPAEMTESQPELAFIYPLYLSTNDGSPRGHDVVFRKDTRIEVTTSPSRSLFHAAEVQQPPSIHR